MTDEERMKYNLIAVLFLVVLSGAIIDSLYCDNSTHTAITPLNILKSIRWDMQGHTVTIGNDYPVSGIELANGTLLATWANEPMSDFDPSNITGALSPDGINWSQPFILVEGNGNKVTEEQYVYNEGNLYEFYTETNETNYISGIEPSTVYLRESNDGTVSNWSDPTSISSWPCYFSITSPPIRLTSGRWVIPVEYVDPQNVTHWYSSTWYSDNFTQKGLDATWIQGEYINDPSVSLSELTIAQMQNGAIYGLLRYDSLGMYFWETSSLDGVSWNDPCKSSIPSPNARAHLLKLTDGKILLAWNDISASSGRNPLSVELLDEKKVVIIARNFRGNEYHNMGIIQRKNGDVIILAATNDIPWSYWFFPRGIEYVTQYVSGVQSYIVPHPF